MPPPMSFAQIADEMGENENTVYSLYSAAMRKLKNIDPEVRDLLLSMTNTDNEIGAGYRVSIQ